MKLVKISTDYYIIVDESEVRPGDYVYTSVNNKVVNFTDPRHFSDGTYKKITHSTRAMYKDEYISLQEVKELIGEVDVEKKADERYFEQAQKINDSDIRGYIVSATKGGFVDGYNQALEDNKEKKYTEFDLHNLLRARRQLYSHTDANVVRDFIQSLQPKTEWEYIGECKGNNGNGCFMDSPGHDCGCYKRVPKTSWEVELVDGKLKLK